MSTLTNTAQKKLIISRLLPFYGNLLTENQREMASLFADEDFSLAEISEQFHVSRQCVHDTITKAEKQMSDLEQKLMLCRKYEQNTAILSECSRRLEKLVRGGDDMARPELNEIRTMIDDLLKKEDS